MDIAWKCMSNVCRLDFNPTDFIYFYIQLQGNRPIDISFFILLVFRKVNTLLSSLDGGLGLGEKEHTLKPRICHWFTQKSWEWTAWFTEGGK